jgi:hypothetical protein
MERDYVGQKVQAMYAKTVKNKKELHEDGVVERYVRWLERKVLFQSLNIADVRCWHKEILWKMPCFKLRKWAISGRGVLDSDLWDKKNATIRVFKKHFIIYEW